MTSTKRLDVADTWISHPAFLGALEAAPIGLLLVDPFGKIRLINRKAEALFGYQPEELQDSAIEVLVPERFRALHVLHRDRFSISPQNRPMGIGRELRGFKKDGTEFSVEIGLKFLQMHNSFWAMAAVIDASKRKNLDEDFSRFIFAASHHLQEPLRKIQTFASMILEQEKTVSPLHQKDQKEYIEKMVENASLMGSLINNLIEYHHFTKKIDCLKVIDLNEVINEAIHDLEDMIHETKAQIQVKVEGAYIMAEFQQIKHLFKHLLVNGIKYSKKNETPRLMVESLIWETGVKIGVKDHGIGIESSHFSKLFQPFKPLHPRSEYPGNGIGLAICKKIVEQYNGNIFAENNTNGGSVFYVQFFKCVI